MKISLHLLGTTSSQPWLHRSTTKVTPCISGSLTAPTIFENQALIIWGQGKGRRRQDSPNQGFCSVAITGLKQGERLNGKLNRLVHPQSLKKKKVLLASKALQSFTASAKSSLTELWVIKSAAWGNIHCYGYLLPSACCVWQHCSHSPLAIPHSQGGSGNTGKWLRRCARHASVSSQSAFQAWDSQREGVNFQNPPETPAPRGQVHSVQARFIMDHCCLHLGKPRRTTRPLPRSATGAETLLNKE